MNIQAPDPNFSGDKIKIARILNKQITIEKYRIVDSKYEGKRLDLQITHDGEQRVAWTSSSFLMDMIQKVPQEDFPFIATIIKDNERYLFT